MVVVALACCVNTEVRGDGMAQLGGHQAHQRGLVGRGHHHDGAAQAGFAQRQVDELAHFAAALADQAHDHDIGRGNLCVKGRFGT